MIKATELALIALIAKESLIMTYTPLLAKYMAKYEINTKQRKSAFIATMKRQIKTMQNIINDFETRAKHAESNFCSVTECELRIPKIGTYKPK